MCCCICAALYDKSQPRSVLSSLICTSQAPRPIALVGTYSDDGTANLAPMSWYNMVSHDPPLVMISFGGARERVKDGEHNILTRKVFTISSTYVLRCRFCRGHMLTSDQHHLHSQLRSVR